MTIDLSDKIIVLDTETSIHNVGDDAIGSNKASAFHPYNKIIALGAETQEEDYQYAYSKDGLNHLNFNNSSEGTPYLWIGQNIKFDFHHIFKNDGNFQYGTFPYIQIWDTQLAEYLITGQEHKYASLDQLATKYGGTLKNDIVKEMWENGIDTEDIPKSVLLPYLKQDVRNTHIVFAEQLKIVDEMGLMPLVMSQMDALKCTIEMEYNGMHFDTRIAAGISLDLEVQTIKLTGRVATEMYTIYPLTYDFNINSSQQIAVALFGGTYKHVTDEPVLLPDGSAYTYKTGKRKGQIKYKKKTVELLTDGFSIPFKDKWKTPSGGMSTADDVLKDIIKSYVIGTPIHQLAADILEYRTLNKQLKTYFKGYSDLTWPIDSCIHQGLNHTSTATGRLSSSKPNLQNVTNKGD